MWYYATGDRASSDSSNVTAECRGSNALVYGVALWNAILVLCLLAVAVVIGTRDIGVGTDTAAYLNYYQRVQECRCLPGAWEPGFELLTLGVALIGASPVVYLVIVALLLLFLVWCFSGNVAELVGRSTVVGWKLRSAVLTFILLSPFFFNASVNVLRHGLSSFLVLSAALLMMRSQWRRAILAAIGAVSFHKTALLYLPLLPVWLVMSVPARRRLLVVLLLALSTIYGIGFADDLVQLVSSLAGLDMFEMIANYGAWASHYRSGVRWDFLGFSLSWYFMGVVISRGFIVPRYRNLYRTLVDLYGIILIPFLLFGWGNFSDRFLLVPWQFIPVIIAGLVVFGAVRARSRGHAYGIALLASMVGMLGSVLSNQPLVRWLLQELLR